MLVTVYYRRMRFAMTDEQEMLRDAVRDGLARELPLPVLREALDAGRGEAATARVATDQGWPGIGIDEADGGQGGGVVEQALLAEELGAAAAPSSRVLASALAGRLLAGSAGGGALLRSLAAGERCVVPALDAATGVLEPTGGDAVETPNVLGLPEAEVVLVLVQDHLRAVDVTTGDATIAPRALLDPGRSIGDLALASCDGEDLGPVAAADLLSLGAVLVAAEAIGAARRMLEMTVAYVGQREQFGVVIGAFQAVKHAAADMLVDVETSRSLVSYAAWAVEVGASDAAAAASMAKAHAVPAAAAVADRALALHGAIGFTWEHDLHLLLKRAHTAKGLFGSAAAHRSRLAGTLDLTGAGPRVPVVA